MNFIREVANPLLRRVVVTGMGAVTPLGNNLTSTWGAILNRNSLCRSENEAHKHDEGCTSIPDQENDGAGLSSLHNALLCQGLPANMLRRELEAAKGLPCQVAAPVRFGYKYDNRTARFVQFALTAGEEAAKHAELHEWLNDNNDSHSEQHPPVDKGEISDVQSISTSHVFSEDAMYQRRHERVGVCIASGMSSVREFSLASDVLYNEHNSRRISPHFIPKVLLNSPSGRLALQYNLQGPNHTASTACAAGAHAIGDAMRFIQYNDADIMFAGGTESSIDPLSISGFCRLRALSTNFNDAPNASSRPFDARRDGFVMGEGACVLVLEELEHARRRNVPILCEIVGYGVSGDAYHITSPHPEGGGAQRSMQMALRRGGLTPCHVDYVNAHATSTPVGDAIEANVIRKIFLPLRNEQNCTNIDRTDDLFVSSTKGASGHLLGAAGALEAALSVLSIVEGKIPSTWNCEEDDVCTAALGFKLVMGDQALEKNVKVAMSNSFGFGGTNASLVFASTV